VRRVSNSLNGQKRPEHNMEFLFLFGMSTLHDTTTTKTSKSSAKWLVAVDDSIWSSYAFNYATTYANPEVDRIYLMHVTEEGSYIGYATPTLLQNIQFVQEEKAKKILIHYGLKCHELGFRFTMMQGTHASPGHLLVKAMKNFDISTVVLGRRSLGSVESMKRAFVGSTSKYVVEHACCNVTVVKQPPFTPFGSAEERDKKIVAIQAEEPDFVCQEEEDEREKRLKWEDTCTKASINKMIKIYRFKTEMAK